MNKHISYSGCFPMTSREAMIHGMLEQFGQLQRIERAEIKVERSAEAAYPFRLDGKPPYQWRTSGRRALHGGRMKRWLKEQ